MYVLVSAERQLNSSSCQIGHVHKFYCNFLPTRDWLIERKALLDKTKSQFPDKSKTSAAYSSPIRVRGYKRLVHIGLKR